MNVQDTQERLSTLDSTTLLSVVLWDPNTQQFSKWGLSGITQDGTLVMGDLLDTSVDPGAF